MCVCVCAYVHVCTCVFLCVCPPGRPSTGPQQQGKRSVFRPYCSLVLSQSPETSTRTPRSPTPCTVATLPASNSFPQRTGREQEFYHLFVCLLAYLFCSFAFSVYYFIHNMPLHSEITVIYSIFKFVSPLYSYNTIVSSWRSMISVCICCVTCVTTTGQPYTQAQASTTTRSTIDWVSSKRAKTQGC